MALVDFLAELRCRYCQGLHLDDEDYVEGQCHSCPLAHAAVEEE